MMKKVLSLFLAVSILISLLPVITMDVDAATTLYWPVPGHVGQSRGYSSSHQALDIRDDSINGAGIVAAVGGTVTRISKCTEQHYGEYGDCGGTGTGVVIKGDDGRYYSYAHMTANSIPTGLVVGTKLRAGTIIGRVGTTGNSSGPHLHFSIATGTDYLDNRIDPAKETYQYVSMMWPVPGHTSLSRGYSSDHGAIDINDSSINGAKIVAALGGTVTRISKCTEQHSGSSGDCGGTGTGVVVKGTDGRYYSYAHMQAGSIPSSIAVGKTVTVGTVLGLVGTTGNSSGPHLHFSIATGKDYLDNRIDPMKESYIYAFAGDDGNAWFSDYDEKVSVSANDAVIAMKLNKPAGTSVGDYGARLYDKWGSCIGTVSGTSSANTNATYTYMWWQVSEDMSVKLWPGQTYTYEFWAVVDGITYTSGRNSITTTGTAPNITISFDGNGATGTMDPMQIVLGSVKELPLNTFTKEGYLFAGWNALRGDGRWYYLGAGWLNDKEAGSTTAEKKVYGDGSTISMDTSWYRGLDSLYDYTFYAVWVKDESHTHSYNYDVTMAPTGGRTGVLNGICDGCGASINVEIPVLNTEDYTYTVVAAPDCVSNGLGRYSWNETAYGKFYFDVTLPVTEWSETYPEGIDEELIESRTEYRYSEKISVVSEDPTLEGYQSMVQEWERTGGGTVDYVASWHSGFDTSHSLYAQYNKKPVPSSETSTSLTMTNSSNTVGYIMWHWCRGSYENGPINRKMADGKTSTYTKFHAFYSTGNGSNTDPDGSDGGGTSVRYHPNSSCCKDTYWYLYIPVTRQTYSNYKAVFTYSRWSDWSEWTTDFRESSDTMQVETRVLYRYVIEPTGEHSWDEGETIVSPTCQDSGSRSYHCGVCGLTKTEDVAPLGHSYSGMVTAPTCTEDGYTTYSCAACGESYTGDIVAAIGHSYAGGICSYCGEADPNYVVDPNGPKIVVSSAMGRAGDTVTVTVDLENNPGFAGLNVYLTYSDSLTLVEATSSIGLTFTNDVTMVWDGISDHTEDGELLKLVFQVSDDAQVGEHFVKVSFIEAFTAELEDVTFATVDGYVEVIDLVYGDANGDGIVNTKDIILIRRYVAAKDPATGASSVEVDEGADANGDGVINTKDIILVRRHVAAKDPNTGESSVVLGPNA